MELQTTIHDMWNIAISSSETTLGLLSVFKGKDHVLIENAVKALKQLVIHGRTYEKMTQYCPELITAKVPKPILQIDPYEMEDYWTRLDDKTIQVDLGSNKFITAIAVTTEAQLKSVIEAIYSSECVAIDCEFLVMKKELPTLKLIQIAVSKERGYAIQVDSVGHEVITNYLKPVLEDKSLNWVGWAYRADAMSIESYLKDVELSPVLDLQAKLKSVTPELLSLNNAVARYATDWEGMEVFRSIKDFRNTFSYSIEDCVWAKTPMPAKVLVYSVFDTVSLIALKQSTDAYPNLDGHYWPTTITATNQRAVDRWHRQRTIGRQAPSGNQGIIAITEPSAESSWSSTNDSLSEVKPNKTIDTSNLPKLEHWLAENAHEQIKSDDNNDWVNELNERAMNIQFEPSKPWSAPRTTPLMPVGWTDDYNSSDSYKQSRYIEDTFSSQDRFTSYSRSKSREDQPFSQYHERHSNSSSIYSSRPETSSYTNTFNASPSIRASRLSQPQNYSPAPVKPEEMAGASWGRFANESKQSSVPTRPNAPIEKQYTKTHGVWKSNSCNSQESTVATNSNGSYSQPSKVPGLSQWTSIESQPLSEEELVIWIDNMTLEEAPYQFSLNTISRYEQLERIKIPTEPYVCIIHYHCVGKSLKALQVYIATESAGDSYMVLIDRFCYENKQKMKNSRLAYLISSPEVKRGMWKLEDIQNLLMEMVGVYAGPSVNLPYVVHVDSKLELSFDESLEHYLSGWKDFSIYQEKKSIKKSIPDSLWDQKEIPKAILEYSAFCGLAMYKLFKHLHDKCH